MPEKTIIELITLEGVSWKNTKEELIRRGYETACDLEELSEFLSDHPEKIESGVRYRALGTLKRRRGDWCSPCTSYIEVKGVLAPWTICPAVEGLVWTSKDKIAVVKKIDDTVTIG